MNDKGDRHAARVRGKQAVDMQAQELAWAANVPLGRIDWQPDPELEAGAPAERYLLTLLTDAARTQEVVSGEFLENFSPHRDSDKALLREMVERLRP